MTHNELLSLIDYYQVEGSWDIPEDSERFEMVAKNYRAFRAVVESHEPQEITLPNGEWGTNCPACDGWEYPCPTIQKIIEELK